MSHEVPGPAGSIGRYFETGPMDSYWVVTVVVFLIVLREVLIQSVYAVCQHLVLFLLASIFPQQVFFSPLHVSAICMAARYKSLEIQPGWPPVILFL